MKFFTDQGKIVLDEGLFYKQLISKDEFSKNNPATIPAIALIDNVSKSFFNPKGELIKDVSPEVFNQAQAPTIVNKSQQIDYNQAPKLKELIPTPLRPEKYNHLYYPKYEINANIVYAGKNDFDIIDEGRPCSARSMNTPIQKLVREGIVHIYGSPLPGEVRYPTDPPEFYGFDDKGKRSEGKGIGSSYIVGHSSECTQHAYTRIFEPLMKKSQVGEEFFIWDQMGRKLKFNVIEVKEINDVDTNSAYKDYPNRRIVTLQTSVFYTMSNIKRWLTIGELEIPKK
ncbi:MAG: hypothetical protein ACRCXZ_02090 [Patescibacteria group bacterium]